MKQLIAILSLFAGTLLSNLALADTLFDNGTAVETSGFCMSGPNACGGAGTWTVFDDFILSSQSLIEGFSFAMGNVSNANSYLSTNWSIWNTSPTIGGSALLSGNAKGNLANISADEYQVSIENLSFELAAGTYWVGLNSIGDANIDSIFSYMVTGEAGNAFSSDLVETTLYKGKTLAFQINGITSAVPEPATYVMLFIGLIGVVGVSRKKLRVS